MILYCDSTIRLCGLQDSSAILATLKNFLIDIEIDIDISSVLDLLSSWQPNPSVNFAYRNVHCKNIRISADIWWRVFH